MFQEEIETICQQISTLGPKGKRIMIGVAGPPAAGKSTLAELLVERLNEVETARAALVPMDGYHLDNEALDAQNMRERKGAPQTFDADGFVALVKKISQTDDAVSYATFDRANDRTVPNSATVAADTNIVVVEGNYLLLNTTPWSDLKALFDLSVFIRPSIKTLEDRLIQRWLSYGFDQDAAEKKARSNDIPNAMTILDNSAEADLSFGGI